jgi:hypothetical protein
MADRYDTTGNPEDAGTSVLIRDLLNAACALPQAA